MAAAETKHVRIRRNLRGFGFTLRYYVDEGSTDMGPKYTGDGRNSQLYEQHRDAIVFIKNVLSQGPADVAGLNVGDRVQAINGFSVRGKSYHEIVKVVQESPEELDLLVVPQAVHSESFEGAGLKLKAVTAKPLFHQHQVTIEPLPSLPIAPVRQRALTMDNWTMPVKQQQQQYQQEEPLSSDRKPSEQQQPAAMFRTQSANATTMVRPIRVRQVVKFDDDDEDEEEEEMKGKVPVPSEERKPGDGGEASPVQKSSPLRQKKLEESSSSSSSQRVSAIIGSPPRDPVTSDNSQQIRRNLGMLSFNSPPYYHAGLAAAHYPTEIESPAALYDDDDDDDFPLPVGRRAPPIVRMQSERPNHKKGNSPCQSKAGEFRRSATVGWERKCSFSAPTSPLDDSPPEDIQQPLDRMDLSDGEDTGGTNTTGSPAVDHGFYSSKKFQFEGLMRTREWKSSHDDAHPFMQLVSKSGYLRQKQTVESSGRKARDRSWRLNFYQLRGHMLYSFKDEKESKLMKPADIPPVSVKSCRVDIAHGYQKRPNTFRLILFNGSEYLFNTDTQENMLVWIKAIRDNSDPDNDQQNAGRSDLIIRKAVQQEQKLADKGVRTFSARLKKKQDSLRAARRTNSLRVPRRNTGGKDGQESPIAQRRSSSMFRRKGASGGHSSHGVLDFDDFGDQHYFRKTLSECKLSLQHENVPLLIARCAMEIEKRGMDVEGIYRIPGKKSDIRTLAEEFNRDVYNASFEDQRWGDIHSISSLLKLFLRDLTEPIFPTDMYDNFMSASKVEDDDQRLIMLKQLIQQLPDLHFSTLRFIVQHLQKVASKADMNRMYPRNLAIVFGPTLVRKDYDSMQHLVSHMGDQCKIVESLVTHCSWFFAPVPEEGKRSGVFLRPSRSGDWSILPQFMKPPTQANTPPSKMPPRKPRRTWEYDPADPDTGTELSDFWVRYPPTIDHSGLASDFSGISQSSSSIPARAAAVSLASSRADSTRQWISQMSNQAWQTESSTSSSPNMPRKRLPSADAVGDMFDIQHRGSLSSFAGVHVRQQRGNSHVTYGVHSDAAPGGEPVVRRQHRGRQQWRDVTVTGSGDFADGRLADFNWSKMGASGVGKTGRERTGRYEGGGGGGKGTDSMKTTLL